MHYACAPPRSNLKTGAGRVQCMCIIRRTSLVYSLLDRRLWGCRYNPNMEYAAFTHLIAVTIRMRIANACDDLTVWFDPRDL